VAIGKPVELIKKPTIFQSGAGKQSPLRKVVEGLGSDGVLAQALDEGAEKVNVNVGTVIPELFRSVMQTPEKEKTEAKGAVENKGKKAASILRLPSTLDGVVHATYEKWAPPQARELIVSLRKWWTQERLSRRVEACLPNRELDVVVVDGRVSTPFRFLHLCLRFFLVLSHLTAASLTEDTYGIVQRDIPRILEALLSFLQAVEDYRAEVRGMYVEQEPAPEVGEKEREERELMGVEVERGGEVLGYVEDSEFPFLFSSVVFSYDYVLVQA
jgi:nucleoporin NDC1